MTLAISSNSSLGKSKLLPEDLAAKPVADTEYDTISENESTEDDDPIRSQGYILPAKYIKSVHRTKPENASIPLIPMKKTFKLNVTKSVADNVLQEPLEVAVPRKNTETDEETVSDYETETEFEKSDEEQINNSTLLLKTPTAINHTGHSKSTVKLLKQNFFKLSTTPNSENGRFSSFTPLKHSADNDSSDSDYAYQTGSPLMNRTRTKNRTRPNKKLKAGTADDPFIEYGNSFNGYKLIGKKSEVRNMPQLRAKIKPSDPYKLLYEAAASNSKAAQDPLEEKYKPAKASQDYEIYTNKWSLLTTIKEIAWPTQSCAYEDVNHTQVTKFLKHGSEMILEKEFRDKMIGNKQPTAILTKIYKNVLKNERIRWHPDKMKRILTTIGLLDEKQDEKLIEKITFTFQLINQIYETTDLT